VRCHIDAFPKRLNDLVKCLGHTQASFAKLIGITPAAMSQLLSGQRDPAAETLMKIHKATGASIDRLFGIDK
jgi:transcriptional regulator with XRE-family HTH domain